MNKKIACIFSASLAAFAPSAVAGGSVAANDAVTATSSSSTSACWCDKLKSIGALYSDKNHPFIQEVKFFGRAQYQWGYTDGELNGVDFDSNGDEIRRLRLGTSVKFLNGFKFKANANLEDGGFRNHDLGFNSFDELYLTYSFGDVAGFEDTNISYGRHKFAFSQEVHTSSKNIKTVERSNISNFFYQAARPTGVLFAGSRGGVDWTAGLLSTDADEVLGQWDEGIAYYFSAGFNASNGRVTLDAIYNDAGSTDQDIFGYEWAVSAAYETTLGRWEFMANALYGETHGGDGVYGLVLMPSTYLIEDKLEAVFRYQFAGADNNALTINSRNVRNAAREDIGAPSSAFRGNKNHTLYAGLNYYLCGHNTKIMTGVEYETLDGRATDAEALTLWGAFRFYF